MIPGEEKRLRMNVFSPMGKCVEENGGSPCLLTSLPPETGIKDSWSEAVLEHWPFGSVLPTRAMESASDSQI